MTTNNPKWHDHLFYLSKFSPCLKTSSSHTLHNIYYTLYFKTLFKNNKKPPKRGNPNLGNVECKPRSGRPHLQTLDSWWLWTLCQKDTLILGPSPRTHNALSLSNIKTSQVQSPLSLTFSLCMFAGDFKAPPSPSLKMTGAAVLCGFCPTNKHLPEFGCPIAT